MLLEFIGAASDRQFFRSALEVAIPSVAHTSAAAERPAPSQARTLLTGYGLEPVPRRAAGWNAISSDRTPPARWAASRRALGLSQRQAVAVSARGFVSRG
jgi:hypothetical protein